jgi:hypothetical protein
MKSTVSLVVRPIDRDGWVMAPDEESEYAFETTLRDLINIICSKRPQISPHRVVPLFNFKRVPDNKYSWTVKKLGAMDGTVITLQPLVLRGWMWESKEHYAELYLKEVASFIINSKTGRMQYEAIETALGAKRPPVLPSTKSLLRMYPDKFFVRTDLNSGKWFVQISNGRQLPTFERSPINLGDIDEYTPSPFPWYDINIILIEIDEVRFELN